MTAAGDMASDYLDFAAGPIAPADPMVVPRFVFTPTFETLTAERLAPLAAHETALETARATLAGGLADQSIKDANASELDAASLEVEAQLNTHAAIVPDDVLLAAISNQAEIGLRQGELPDPGDEDNTPQWPAPDPGPYNPDPGAPGGGTPPER